MQVRGRASRHSDRLEALSRRHRALKAMAEGARLTRSQGVAAAEMAETAALLAGVEVEAEAEAEADVEAEGDADKGEQVHIVTASRAVGALLR